MKTTNAMLSTLIELEGAQSRPYKDVKGLWTIGVGHLILDKDMHLVSVVGQERASNLKTLVLTEEETVELTSLDMSYTMSKLARIFTTIPEQNVLDSFVLLSFNIGFGAFYNSTLFKKYKRYPRDPSIILEFLRWSYAGNTQVKGLLKRRLIEASIFSKDVENVINLFPNKLGVDLLEVKRLYRYYVTDLEVEDGLGSLAKTFN